MTFIHRRVENQIISLQKQVPVLALVGARQVGKSTLAKHHFPQFTFLDLENPKDFAHLKQDISYVLENNLFVVIDEAQRMPELFPALRNHVDRFPKSKVVLLGSSSPHLTKGISESLTGRVAFLEVTGILEKEFQPKPHKELWLKGNYPSLHWRKPKITPEVFYSNLLKTYLEQDIPGLGYKLSSIKLRAMLQMLAHSQGSIVNYSELCNSLGLKHSAVTNIIDIFSGTYIVRTLQPYFVNIGKRLVKSPKIYIRDTGLLHHLLDIPSNLRDIERHPKLGASFESFCIEQICGAVQSAYPGTEFYFYRTQAGAECDLIFKKKKKLFCVEIKWSSQVPNLKGLLSSMTDLGAKHAFIVSHTETARGIKPGIEQLGLTELLEKIL